MTSPQPTDQFTDKNDLPLWGRVLICGTTDFGNAGRKTVPKNDTPSTYPDLSSVHIVRALSNIRVSKIRTSHSSSHVVFLSVEGNAFVMGRNEHGQLGFKPERPTSNGKAGKTTGDLYTGAAIHSPAKLRRQDFQPALPPGKDGDIVEAATGRHHTLLITRSGQVYCAGLGTQGQLGRSVAKDVYTFTRVDAAPFVKQRDPVVQASAGIDFSLVLTASGKVYSFGSMEHLQLGNGTSGEHIVTAGKTAFGQVDEPTLIRALTDHKVIQVSCGQHHAIALTDKGVPYVWGFGGYGRLGLGNGHDASPTPVQQFDRDNDKLRATQVIAGPTSSVVLDGQKTFWLAGKWKSTGDGGTGQGFMYFKYLIEMMGVKVNGAALGGVTLFAIAEEAGSTSPHGATMNVCWGQNATYGELGLGDGRPKSATKPQRWEALDNVAVLQVGAALGTTFILARNLGETYGDLPRWPEEIPVESDCCQVCGSNDEASSNARGEMLECEKCDLAYHLQCLDPPLDEVPEGEWHCPVCKDRGLREVGFPLPSRADDPEAEPVDLDDGKKAKRSAASNDNKRGAPTKKVKK